MSTKSCLLGSYRWEIQLEQESQCGDEWCLLASISRFANLDRLTLQRLICERGSASLDQILLGAARPAVLVARVVVVEPDDPQLGEVIQNNFDLCAQDQRAIAIAIYKTLMRELNETLAHSVSACVDLDSWLCGKSYRPVPERIARAMRFSTFSQKE